MVQQRCPIIEYYYNKNNCVIVITAVEDAELKGKAEPDEGAKADPE